MLTGMLPGKTKRGSWVSHVSAACGIMLARRLDRLDWGNRV